MYFPHKMGIFHCHVSLLEGNLVVDGLGKYHLKANHVSWVLSGLPSPPSGSRFTRRFTGGHLESTIRSSCCHVGGRDERDAWLGGGFKDFLFSRPLGEDFQFDYFFLMGCNHQVVGFWRSFLGRKAWKKNQNNVIFFREKSWETYIDNQSLPFFCGGILNPHPKVKASNDFKWWLPLKSFTRLGPGHFLPILLLVALAISIGFCSWNMDTCFS